MSRLADFHRVGIVSIVVLSVRNRVREDGNLAGECLGTTPMLGGIGCVVSKQMKYILLQEVLSSLEDIHSPGSNQ